MSDLRKIKKSRNRGNLDKRVDFSHDLKKKEHLKPSIYSVNEPVFNPNSDPTNVKIKKTDEGGDPDDINHITINIDLKDNKKGNSITFTSGFLIDGDGGDDEDPYDEGGGNGNDDVSPNEGISPWAI